jgi:hypothetical protein
VVLRLFMMHDLRPLLLWIKQNDDVIGWVVAGSAALTVVTLLALPWIVARIPDDYFATRKRPPIRHRSQHPVLRWTLRIAKSVLGLILVLLGLVMVLGPGQGLIAILAGLLLLEFPGKRRLEMWVIRRPGLLRGINWLRARRGRPPLTVWQPAPPRRLTASPAPADRHQHPAAVEKP